MAGASPWAALLGAGVPGVLPLGVRQVLVVDGRRVTDPDQLRRYLALASTDTEPARCQLLLQRAAQIAATQALTPEQRRAHRMQYMRTYRAERRARMQQARLANRTDPNPAPPP